MMATSGGDNDDVDVNLLVAERGSKFTPLNSVGSTPQLGSLAWYIFYPS